MTQCAAVDLLALAHDVLDKAKGAGADDADVLLLEGTDFSVTVRKGEVETLTDAGSRGLGLRVFVGRRTASVYTSDFSGPAFRALVETAGRPGGAPHPRPDRPGPPRRRDEVTIAGNLTQMLKDVDAVGNDLVLRGSSAAPNLRIRHMTVSGS